MKKDVSYESELIASIHRTVRGLHRIGLVDTVTMREFDEGCLTPVERIAPEDLRELRMREGASQAVWAKHLGVATATVGQWERGQRTPTGPAAKLLALVKAKGLRYIS